MPVQTVFERHEKKYLLSQGQAADMRQMLRPYMKPDDYGQHTICSLYFDTEDFESLRRRENGSSFRERLRLRSYGVPGPDGIVYLELKKKACGVSYKRRMGLPLAEAKAFLASGAAPEGSGQIGGEIEWFLAAKRPEAKNLICYDRVAWFGRQDTGLRLTFDQNIRWRGQSLDLARGDWGSLLTEPGAVMMEIKTPGAIPYWLARALSLAGAYPVSFSKYGNVCELLNSGEVARHAG